MTTEAEWREGALRAINVRSSIGPYAAAGVLDALITAGYVTPPQPDAVPEGHVRVRIPVHSYGSKTVGVHWTLDRNGSGVDFNSDPPPVIATVIADMPLPSEPPAVRGRVETP